MSTKCNVKDVQAAWNAGLDEFKKKFNGSNATSSIRDAIREIKYSHPKIDFDINSFVDPLVSSLKKEGYLEDDYDFFKPKGELSDEAKRNKIKNKVINVVGKFEKLDEDEKKKLAKKMYDKFDKDGMLDEPAIQDMYAEVMGLPSVNSKDTQDSIKSASEAMKNFNDAENNLKKKIEEFESLSEEEKKDGEKNKKFAKEILDLKNERDLAQRKAQRERITLSGKIKEKRFSELNFVDFMVMNLLSPTTLLMNITGMVFDTGVRYPARAVSSIVNATIGALKKESPARNILGRTSGVLKSLGKAATAIKEATLYNNTTMSDDLPRADHLNSVQAFKKMIDDGLGKKSFKNFLGFFFRIHPDFVKRGLAGPDAFFHAAILGGELNMIANQKGLKGAEKEIFLANPDEKSIERAMKIADEATLRTENRLTKKLAVNPEAFHKELVESGLNPYASRVVGFLRYFGIKMLAPFTKTPVNLVNLAARYAIPGYEVVRTSILASKEKDASARRQIISDGIGVATVGFAIQRAAFMLLASGAISAGFSDDDEKTREATEKRLGGPNRVNFSAFLRLLYGGSPDWKKGDTSLELRSLGVLGMVLGAHAHAYNKYSKGEIEEKSKLTNAPLTIPSETLATLSSALDNTFLSGANQFIEVFRADDDYKRGKYLNAAITNLFTGIAPSTYQKISMSNQANQKQSYDKEKPFIENLYNTLGYKFLFGGGEMKDKYFSLVESEKDVIKKKDYMLFDNMLGRVLQSELGMFKSRDVEETPLTRLYFAAKDVDKSKRGGLFPPSINKEQTFNIDNEDVKVVLNKEQYDFFLKKASLARAMSVTPYISSEKFKEDSHEVRIKTLETLYKDGLNLAKSALIERYYGQLSVIESAIENKEEVKQNLENFRQQEEE